jgi:predicted nucleotidyltransferase
VRRRE